MLTVLKLSIKSGTVNIKINNMRIRIPLKIQKLAILILLCYPLFPSPPSDGSAISEVKYLIPVTFFSHKNNNIILLFPVAARIA
jgi:hypothetical protein